MFLFRDQKKYGNNKISPDSLGINLSMFLFFPFFFFFLLRRLVGSRFLGAPSIESLVCPSSPGQSAWSRAGTASRGQSKGRTGLLAFPERAH